MGAEVPHIENAAANTVEWDGSAWKVVSINDRTV